MVAALFLFMPGWKNKDAKRHTRKANSASKQRQWRHVAESAMSRGADEGSAIRQANGVVAKNRGRKRSARRRR
jgi:hypothetical protein